MTITYESTCPDCGAAVGQPHKDGCDVARCLVTGGQRLQCGDEDFPDGVLPGENCGDDTWIGEWPGKAGPAPQPADAPRLHEGQCKKCPETVSGETARDAVDAAMKHAGDVHGNRYLGFRWR